MSHCHFSAQAAQAQTHVAGTELLKCDISVRHFADLCKLLAVQNVEIHS